MNTVAFSHLHMLTVLVPLKATAEFLLEIVDFITHWTHLIIIISIHAIGIVASLLLVRLSITLIVKCFSKVSMLWSKTSSTSLTSLAKAVLSSLIKIGLSSLIQITSLLWVVITSLISLIVSIKITTKALLIISIIKALIITTKALLPWSSITSAEIISTLLRLLVIIMWKFACSIT